MLKREEMNSVEQDEYVKEKYGSKKRRSISKKERITIAEKTNGRCGYCGIDLPRKWHIDHIEPFAKDSSTCDQTNLMAACPQCNLFKSTFSLKQFRKELSFQLERAREYSVNFRFAEKFNQVKATPSKILFYFEEIEKPTLSSERKEKRNE